VTKYQYHDFAPLKGNNNTSERWSIKSSLLIVFTALLFLSCYKYFSGSINPEGSNNGVDANKVKEVVLPAQLDFYADFNDFPLPDTFSYKEHIIETSYALDSVLNARVNLYLRRYRPEAAVYLICDLESGRILAVGERRDSAITPGPKMAFQGGFPAASLIKIIPAYTALNAGRTPQDKLVQIGAYHTLYSRQLRVSGRSNLPTVSLKKAFARSINPAFGLLGQDLGAKALRNSGKLLGFNRKNLPDKLEQSVLVIPDSGYHLAEVSCGFTQKTTVSPIHMLELTRTLGHDGRHKSVYFSNSFELLSGGKISQNPEIVRPGIISKGILSDMQELMAASISRGTCRKSFHKHLKRHHLEKLIVGAKTGSLDGPDPKGRYDWFIGYEKLKENPEKGIAVVIMQVHQTYQSLRSAEVAALLFKDWLRYQQKQSPKKPTA
jgi:peptidoglycan glycosyltransferase